MKTITKDCGWGKHQDCAATTSGKGSAWCGCKCHKEAERQAKEAATQAFINERGGVVATTVGTHYQRGELVIITGKNEPDRILVCARCEYVSADWESNEDGGYYADFCEPTAEEKQSAEYQKLQERIEADARHEAHVTEQARLAAQEDGWDDVDWDMSLACNAGHHDNCSGKNCTCKCHKPTQPTQEPTESAPSGASIQIEKQSNDRFALTQDGAILLRPNGTEMTYSRKWSAKRALARLTAKQTVLAQAA